MPHPWASFFFLPLTRQDRFKTICYKYQLAFFILKLDQGISYFHSKVSLSFYGPFLVSHSVTNKIYCQHFLIARVWLSCMIGQIPHLPRLAVKFPTPAAVLKAECPTPGGREGVKCPWYAQGEGEGGC